MQPEDVIVGLTIIPMGGSTYFVFVGKMTTTCCSLIHNLAGLTFLAMTGDVGMEIYKLNGRRYVLAWLAVTDIPLLAIA